MDTIPWVLLKVPLIGRQMKITKVSVDTIPWVLLKAVFSLLKGFVKVSVDTIPWVLLKDLLYNKRQILKMFQWILFLGSYLKFPKTEKSLHVR